MAQRQSEYKRNEHDFYATPDWVTRALLPFLGRGKHTIWEPCAGDGKMGAALMEGGHFAVCSDLNPSPRLALSPYGTPMPITHEDFLSDTIGVPFDGIVTNPPFGRLGPKFLRRALELTRPQRGFVAMLFPMDFDAAPGRRDLFAEHPAFDKKIVLTKRIIWMDTEGVKAAPSMHHSWYVWCWQRHPGPATLHYV